MNSFTLRTGTDGCTQSAMGAEATCVIATKSLRTSSGIPTGGMGTLLDYAPWTLCYNSVIIRAMKVALRKIGNSVGIIIPKTLLDQWGVGEGDHLSVGKDGIHPPAMRKPAHEALDELKRKVASAVASQCTANEIRSRSLANLHRWKNNGVWVSAYDEWREILESGDDGRLFAVMFGRDESSTRLRQSAPYVGLLARDVLGRLNEEAAR